MTIETLKLRYPDDGLWRWPFTEGHLTDEVTVVIQNRQIVSASITIYHNWLSHEVLGWVAEANGA